jgi:hypothetical protein
VLFYYLLYSAIYADVVALDDGVADVPVLCCVAWAEAAL